MVDEGLFERFPAEAVYGLHNMPGIESGKIALMPGPMMASADFFAIEVGGIGAHGAFPHHGIDPIVVGAEMVLALQRIVSRSTDPMKSVVVSATQFHAGHTTNVIPETALISGTTRTFAESLQDMVEQSIRQIAAGVAAAHGAKAKVTYERRYPATVNTAAETELAARSAAGVVGPENVLRHLSPIMGSEDFGWMLKVKPGCYVWLGNGTGKGGCHVHNPGYDFNDDILPIGASYWATLTEDLLRAG
jgi:hippurate hydrolase